MGTLMVMSEGMNIFWVLAGFGVLLLCGCYGIAVIIKAENKADKE